MVIDHNMLFKCFLTLTAYFALFHHDIRDGPRIANKYKLKNGSYWPNLAFPLPHPFPKGSQVTSNDFLTFQVNARIEFRMPSQSTVPKDTTLWATGAPQILRNGLSSWPRISAGNSPWSIRRDVNYKSAHHLRDLFACLQGYMHSPLFLLAQPEGQTSRSTKQSEEKSETSKGLFWTSKHIAIHYYGTFSKKFQSCMFVVDSRTTSTPKLNSNLWVVQGPFMTT